MKQVILWVSHWIKHLTDSEKKQHYCVFLGDAQEILTILAGVE